GNAEERRLECDCRVAGEVANAAIDIGSPHEVHDARVLAREEKRARGRGRHGRAAHVAATLTGRQSRPPRRQTSERFDGTRPPDGRCILYNAVVTVQQVPERRDCTINNGRASPGPTIPVEVGVWQEWPTGTRCGSAAGNRIRKVCGNRKSAVAAQAIRKRTVR